MKFMPAALEGVLLIEPRVWEDERGCFFESYRSDTFAAHGLEVVFVQDNHSVSSRHVLRGMHYQVHPYAQDKLVRVVVGEVFDVVVDVRRDSPNFGRWEGFYLAAANRRMLLVPKGFAHGFCVLSATAEVLYKCSALYRPEAARGFRWNDPRVGIRWPVATPIVCARDRDYPDLSELPDAL